MKAQHSLWHLFVVDEICKLSTFVRGGLWCAELNSIVTFEGDVEESQPFGVFVSCWHQSIGDPTERAWEIFGDSGNGFALRTQPSSMHSVARTFNSPNIEVRFNQVRYLSGDEKPTDVAFEVASSHVREDEMRLAVSFADIADPDDARRKEQIRKHVPIICSNPHLVTEFQEITFVEREGAEAIILPITPADLIEEIVIGPRVSEDAKDELLEMLEGSTLASKIRK
jgi:hypothetical protein